MPFDDPVVGPSPDRPRTPAMRGASMLVVVAVGGIGFGIGRSVGTQPAAPVSSASRSSVPAEEPAGESTVDGGVIGDVTSSYWVPTPMETLYERTTDSGIRIRLQGGQRWNGSWIEGDWIEGDWTAAGYCLADRDARVTFDSDDLVDIGGAGLYSELFRGLRVEAGETGWADDHVVRYLVVQADTATEVAVSWDDGLADRTPTSGGFAVLAVEPTTSDGDVWNMDYTLEVVEPDGVREFGRDDLEYRDDAGYQAGCNPPLPGLPEPGE
ncbi:MAG: hypothetical protein ACO3WU_09395 [Ilumatobacteraceae bacterium]